MKSVNKIILIGNVGADPELKYTPSGVAVATISLATNEQWKDSEGNKQERTDWHSVQVWRKLAEDVVAKYVKKGMKLYIEGSVRHETYEKDGEKKYFTKVVAEKLLFLSSVAREGVASAEASPKDDDLPF